VVITVHALAIASAGLSEKSYVFLALRVCGDKLRVRDGTASPALLHCRGRASEFLGGFPPDSRRPAGHQSTILDLEGELGVRLLLRDRRTVRLTAAGETFRREALEILRRNQEAVRLTKRAALGEVGQLRIGFFGSATAAFLPALVQEYHRRFPDVELTLLELTAGCRLHRCDDRLPSVG
jgi:hypothetical protein